MKLAIILLVTCFVLYACAPELRPLSEGMTPTASIHSPKIYTPSPTPYVHTFEVVAWLDDPTPELGSRVILHGSLLKDGVHLGGMAMRATWPDEKQERGVPNCSVQVIYGAGVCIVETEGFSPNVYVPITLSFEYQGVTYRGQTGITPR